MAGLQPGNRIDEEDHQLALIEGPQDLVEDPAIDLDLLGGSQLERFRDFQDATLVRWLERRPPYRQGGHSLLDFGAAPIRVNSFWAWHVKKDRKEAYRESRRELAWRARKLDGEIDRLAPKRQLASGDRYFMPMNAENNTVPLFSEYFLTISIYNKTGAGISLEKIEVARAEGVKEEEITLFTTDMKRTPLAFAPARAFTQELMVYHRLGMHNQIDNVLNASSVAELRRLFPSLRTETSRSEKASFCASSPT